MNRRAFLLACVAAAACSPQEQQKPAKRAQTTSPAAPVHAAAAVRRVDAKSDLLDFTYSWPAAAARIAALDARLESDMAKDRAEATATADADRKERGRDSIPFNGHYFDKQWAVYGDGARLLSLAAQVSTFTGGAHGNTGYAQILWDKAAGRAIAPADLFADPAAAFALLGRPYCAGLDRQRAEKRQEPLPLKGDDWRTQCPPLGEQVLVPAAEKNGRFDSFTILLGPYAAGPYAEGTYQVDVPVTAAIRALVRPEYRPSFRP